MIINNWFAHENCSKALSTPNRKPNIYTIPTLHFRKRRAKIWSVLCKMRNIVSHHWYRVYRTRLIGGSVCFFLVFREHILNQSPKWEFLSPLFSISHFSLIFKTTWRLKTYARFANKNILKFRNQSFSISPSGFYG